MAKPAFRAILCGDGEESLCIEIRSFGKGNRIEVRQYFGLIPTGNGFNAPIALLEKTIVELQKAKAQAEALGLIEKRQP